MFLTRFIRDRKAHRDFLRGVADDVGREIERWPYEKFLAPAEALSFSRTIEGVNVHFSIEAYDENDAGDLHICLDVDASLPTATFARPSYVFWKRRDGSVDYG